MPLTRIRQTAIGNDSITSAKLAHDLDLDGHFVRMPHGTTAQRPSSPVAGYMRFNTDLGTLEQWNTTTNSWQAIDSPPIITSLAYSGSATATDPAGGETITLTGTNFNSGATVTVGGTSASSVSVVNSTTITFTTPVKTAGDYDVVLVNANGLQATLTNGISYNGTPSFTTAAGNVGSIAEDVAMSTITIVAAEPDGGTLAYSITSGALPTGVSMSSAGAITGTPNVNPASDTTFNFTVTATDDESQTNSRAFNLIVLRPVYATQISNSLRFNDDDGNWMNRTPSSVGNQKTWTMSMWVKHAKLGTRRTLFGAYDGSSSRQCQVYFNTNDKLYFEQGGGASSGIGNTNQVFRDSTAWQHFVFVADYTNSTTADKFKIYVNGSRIPSADITTTDTFEDENGSLNGNWQHGIGAQYNSGNVWDGYLSDVHFIDGQALTPTSFAEEYYGVWAPKAYTGSYGTNGFKLNFSDSSNLGDDTSGNTNDFTANGLASRDSTPDSPTTNFATLNAIAPQFGNVSNGNLSWTASVAESSMSTIAMSSGKWYWEWRVTSNNWYFYLVNDSNIRGSTSSSNSLLGVNGAGSHAAVNCSTQTDSYSSSTNGDVFSCAYDADLGQAEIYQNNSLVLRFNTFTIDGPYFAAFDRQSSSNTGVTHTVNFGQDSTFDGNETVASNADSNGIGEFHYAVPSGYLALCAKNLPESAINTSTDDRPEDYFDAVTYTGNGGSPGTQSVNIGFQPDFVWLKSRPQTYTNYLFNSLSGNNKHLISDVTNGEATLNGTSEAFTFESTGFQVVATGGSALNESGQGADNMVSWSWKAGGAPTASNVATSGAMTANSVSLNGTLQSAYTPDASVTQYPTKMSINTKTGFSIVSWTGNGSAGTWLPHGLNSTPEMMMLKGLDNRVWSVYHKNLTSAANYLQLNSTNGESADGSMFNSVPPNDKRFVVGSYNVVSNVNYIGYFWHSVPGYSKIGFYQSSGQADGIFVELGFKPAWIMIKSAAAGRNWTIWDNVRGHASSVGAGNNPNTTTLFINTNGIETHNAGYAVDFTANGFKTRGQGGEINTTNEKMTFMAFAEDPFKYSEAE